MNKILGAVMILSGIGLLYIGLNESKPNFAEKLAKGTSSFFESLDSDSKGRNDLDDFFNRRHKRGLPYYLAGAGLVAGGIFAMRKK